MNILLIPALKNTRPKLLARYLAKENNTVHFVTWDMPYPITFSNIWNNIKNSWKYKKYKKWGFTVHKIRRLPFFFPIVNKWLFKKQVRKIFKKYKIDIIISESFFNETEPPLNLPFVYDLNDDINAFSKIYGSPIYKLAHKLLKVKKTIRNQVKKSKATLVVSDILMKYAKEYRKDKKVYKIPNGVESWVSNKKCGKQKYNFGSYSLVYVTLFSQWAGLSNLLHAVHKLKKEIKDIKLILVGDGPEMPKVKKLIRDLNIKNNVKLFGRVNDRIKLFKIINSCEIGLNISEKNALRDAASPIKVFEYSALGKKIVSTNLEEVKKLNFPNIFFYEEEENNKNLIKAIKNAFNSKINVKKTKVLVKQYTWENLVKKIQSILENC